MQFVQHVWKVYGMESKLTSIYVGMHFINIVFDMHYTGIILNIIYQEFYAYYYFGVGKKIVPNYSSIITEIQAVQIAVCHRIDAI